MAFGKQIKHYRGKLGWTQRTLSDRSDVDIGTISALERRDATRSSYCGVIAQAFGLTIEQLLDESTDYRVVDKKQQSSRNQWPERSHINEHSVNVPAAQAFDIWLDTATATLSKIAPQYRAQTLEYIELQAQKSNPIDGQNLSMAA